MKPCVTSCFLLNDDALDVCCKNSLDIFKAHGFFNLDFDLSSLSRIYEDNYKDKFYEIKTALDEAGIRLSCCHPPFYHYMTISDSDLEYMRQRTFKSLDAAKILDAPWAVFHPAVKDNVTYINESIEGIKPYLDYARSLGIGIAVENGFSTDADQLLSIIEGLGGTQNGVGACWDVGHANLRFGNTEKSNQYRSITKLGDHLKVVHLHDNFSNHDSHSLPGCGNINWQDIARALIDINFCGDVNFEVSAKNIPSGAKENALEYLKSFADVIIKNAF